MQYFQDHIQLFSGLPKTSCLRLFQILKQQTTLNSPLTTFTSRYWSQIAAFSTETSKTRKLSSNDNDDDPVCHVPAPSQITWSENSSSSVSSSWTENERTSRKKQLCHSLSTTTADLITQTLSSLFLSLFLSRLSLLVLFRAFPVSFLIYCEPLPPSWCVLAICRAIYVKQEPVQSICPEHITATRLSTWRKAILIISNNSSGY